MSGSAPDIDEAFGDLELDDPLVGAEIGNRYRVDDVLGYGGMGVVYAATQVQIERPVAIKVMRIVEPTAMERFRREAVTIGKLGHPSIIDIYDVGRVPDGRPYMVMPRVTGPDLAEVAEERGRLPPAEVVALLAGPASALDAMHRRGFLHRDIKPDNLMIDELDDGERRVLLLDFGLAQMTGGSRLTREGLVAGTPHYMSPEAAFGDEVGPQTDVYSLAAVAFELLVGVAPFEDTNPMQVLTLKAHCDPPTLRESGLEASDALEEVMAAGLAREPENRYGSAVAFIEALAEAARGVTGGTTSPGLAGVSAAPTAPVVDEASEPPAHLAPEEPDAEVDSVPGLHRGARWPVWLAAAALLAVLLAGGYYGLVHEAASEAVAEAAEGPITPPAPEPEVTIDPPRPAPEPPAPPAGADPEEDDTEASREVDPPSPPGPDPRPRRRARRTEAPPSPATLSASTRSAPTSTEDSPDPEGAPDPDRAAARERTAEGTEALMAGMLPRAIERFRSGTLASPRYAPAWRGLGLANERLGRHAEARRAYRRYLSIAPGARDASAIRTRLERL